MIRVLQVITSMYIGGAEKLVADMSILMQKKGLIVDVLLFNGETTSLKQRLINEGIKVYSLSKGGSVYNPLFIYKLLRYLPHYDIVHTHNTVCQLYVAIAARLLKRKQRPRLITTEHSTNNRRRNMILFKFLDKWMYTQYGCVVAISDKANENLTKYLGYEKGRVKTINNGIDFALFNKVRSDTQKDKSQIMLVMVAGFREEKDQNTLIRTMTLLPDNYHLSLVGDGVCRTKSEILVDELGLRPRVHFLGQRGDVPSILKNSDIVIMSSFYEGLSLSSLEGMASGRPFIASDVDGLREITEGVGILFPRGNSEILSEQILLLMNDRAYYNQVVSRCVCQAQKYDIHLTVDNYILIYKEVVK